MLVAVALVLGLVVPVDEAGPCNPLGGLAGEGVIDAVDIVGWNNALSNSTEESDVVAAGDSN